MYEVILTFEHSFEDPGALDTRAKDKRIQTFHIIGMNQGDPQLVLLLTIIPKKFSNICFILIHERDQIQTISKHRITKMIPSYRRFAGYVLFACPKKAHTNTIDVRNNLFRQRRNLHPIIYNRENDTFQPFDSSHIH